MRRHLYLLLLGMLSLGAPAAAQMPLPTPAPDPVAGGINQGRFIGVVVGTTVVYALTSYFLGKTWYTKRVPFHTFNDNGEWLQMDKVGHATTAISPLPTRPGGVEMGAAKGPQRGAGQFEKRLDRAVNRYAWRTRAGEAEKTERG